MRFGCKTVLDHYMTSWDNETCTEPLIVVFHFSVNNQTLWTHYTCLLKLTFNTFPGLVSENVERHSEDVAI